MNGKKVLFIFTGLMVLSLSTYALLFGTKTKTEEVAPVSVNSEAIAERSPDSPNHPEAIPTHLPSSVKDIPSPAPTLSAEPMLAAADLTPVQQKAVVEKISETDALESVDPPLAEHIVPVKTAAAPEALPTEELLLPMGVDKQMEVAHSPAKEPVEPMAQDPIPAPVLAMNEEKEEEEAETLPEPFRPPGAEHGTALVNEGWIWIGGGMNFTTVNQNVPGMSDVTYGRIQGPSVMGRAGFFASDHFGLDLGFRSLPGEIKGSDTIAVANGKYSWKTLSAEGLYRPSLVSEHKQSEWIWRLGVQQHEIPLLVPLAAGRISIASSSLRSVSVGFEHRVKRKKVRIEYAARYMHMIGASTDIGGKLDVKPKLALDGSIGVAYQLGSAFYVGTALYAQYLSYAFTHTSSSGVAFSGNEMALSSSADIKFGLEF